MTEIMNNSYWMAFTVEGSGDRCVESKIKEIRQRVAYLENLD